MEIDWSKAPEGATHYNGTGVRMLWYKLEESVFFYWHPEAQSWQISINPEAVLSLMIPRPAPQWSGEGIPPVGIDIEVMHGTYLWIGARVVGHDGEATIVRTNDGYAGVFPHEYRAIRTEAQIAEEERNAFISEIAALLGWDEKFDGTQRDAGKLYDAGYRKVQP